MPEFSPTHDLFRPEIKFKPLMHAEYPMWGLDYERFNYWLKWAEYWSAIVNSKEIADLIELQNYFASLNVLYKLWRPIIALDREMRKFDDNLSKAKQLKRRLERDLANGLPTNRIITLQLTDILDMIHTELMEIKQVIGLGIPVRKKMKIKEKIKMGMGTKKGEIEVPDDTD